ncbi:MAG TPA: thermonuclease family protein [Hyphomonadaceae bacterium]|nr:thermonuclease family protein [Hyphomonadaceae bacterium]
MPAVQFILLAVALLFFLISTRQYKLPLRAGVWFAGIVALSWAAWVSLSKPGHTGLLSLIGDFFAHIGNPGESLLVQSIGGNWGTMGIAIGPTFDAFLILAILVAVVALIAFTPGEGVERIERPINIALIGAIFGGLMALVIASVGFGGVVKRKVYLNTVSAADVIDGDTIRMGDVSLRLWGIDAPENDQLCRAASGEPFKCGGDSRDHLAGLIADKLVSCGPPVDEDGQRLAPAEMPALAETYGRPIVTCRITTDKGEVDIAEAMVRDGFAHLYQDEDGITSVYQADLQQAITSGAGLHASGDGLFPPWAWRNDPAARCGFLERIGFDKLPDRLRRSCLGFDNPANDNAPPPEGEAEPATPPPAP